LHGSLARIEVAVEPEINFSARNKWIKSMRSLEKLGYFCILDLRGLQDRKHE
jgi:hypothetical protein